MAAGACHRFLQVLPDGRDGVDRSHRFAADLRFDELQVVSDEIENLCAR